MMGVFVQMNTDSHMARHSPVGYVVQENGCWDWVGAATRDGYCQFCVPRSGKKVRQVYAHRYVYELHNGAIPDGMELDHLCKNRSCVNPGHLEPVTHKQNMERGFHATKTHCKHGHELTDDNLVRGLPNRRCLTCDRDRKSRWYRKNLTELKGKVG